VLAGGWLRTTKTEISATQCGHVACVKDFVFLLGILGYRRGILINVRAWCRLAERGSFLALDLGGTNFRVLLISVTDKGEADMKSTIYAISNELMTGPGDKVSA